MLGRVGVSVVDVAVLGAVDVEVNVDDGGVVGVCVTGGDGAGVVDVNDGGVVGASVVSGDGVVVVDMNWQFVILAAGELSTPATENRISVSTPILPSLL